MHGPRLLLLLTAMWGCGGKPHPAATSPAKSAAEPRAPTPKERTPVVRLGGAHVGPESTWATAHAAPPTCTSATRTLTFDAKPAYSDRVVTGGSFFAKLFVGSESSCPERITLTLGFTPPGTTATRTVDFATEIPPRGAFIEITRSSDELQIAGVMPGRYAVNFAVFDERGRAFGKVFSGNPLKFGDDDIKIASPPALPKSIGRNDELVIPLEVENVGDTANKVTALAVFTRPGDTAGIEVYQTGLLAPRGRSTQEMRIPKVLRDEKKIGDGTWLLTVSAFDAAGDRVNSFAGMLLTIGTIRVRVVRKPALPQTLRLIEPLVIPVEMENAGDTADPVSVVVVLTKAGTREGHEFRLRENLRPGKHTVTLTIPSEDRKALKMPRGAWLVTVTAFTGGGERLESFPGQLVSFVE